MTLRKFALLTFLLILPVLFPVRVQAQSCEDQSGHCVWSSNCVYGAPITSDDCNIPMFLCCPDNPNPSCTSQDGHCVFTGTCEYGAPIDSNDCNGIGYECCPNNPVYYNPTCDGTGGFVNTALGCLNLTEPGAFISVILSWGLRLAGGAAFLVFVYAGFIYVTSAGDPKRVKAAQELIVASISGIVLIGLSVILLNFVGVNILNLGGFGFNP